MVKKVLNILLVPNMLKKVDLYPYFSHKMSAYRRDRDEITYISFLIEDDELLQKHNVIWEKVRSCIKEEFNTELI